MSVTDAAAQLPAPEKAGGKGATLKIILAVTAVTILAAVMGGGLGIKLAERVEDAVHAKESAKADSAGELNYTGPTHLKPLASLITNLADPKDVWIRLEASIVFNDEAVASDEALAGKISEDILAFLRTVSLAQIDGPSGMRHLREDLEDRARIRSGGRVEELVIQTLVVQ
jgi:flagellar FliL protein